MWCNYSKSKIVDQLLTAVSDNFGFPVYLYGYASDNEHRKTVPQIRAGEYEGLAEKVSAFSGWSKKYIVKQKATWSLQILHSGLLDPLLYLLVFAVNLKENKHSKIKKK